MGLFFRRLFYFVVPLVIAVILGVSFVHPGTVTVMWEGIRYETSLFFVLCILMLSLLLGKTILRLVSVLLGLPGRVLSSWQDRCQISAMASLKAFLAERFEPGQFYEHQSLDRLLKSPRLQDVGHYLLGHVVSATPFDDSSAPLQSRALCGQAVRRGHWPQVLTLVEDAQKADWPPAWAFWAGVRAHVNRQDMDKAIAFSQQHHWEKAFSIAHKQIITGALQLEKNLQLKDQDAISYKSLEKESRRVPHCWPLAVYTVTRDLQQSQRHKLKLLHHSWGSQPHLSLVTGALQVSAHEKGIDVVMEQLDSWWGDLEESQKAYGFLAKAYVLASGQIWGQAQTCLDHVLEAYPTREAYLLQARIHALDEQDHKMAAQALETALAYSWTPQHHEVEKILIPLQDILPGAMEFIGQHTGGKGIYSNLSL